MTKHIAIVHTTPESPAVRAAGLLAQAKHEAGVHVGLILSQMGDVARMADDVATGGDIYPAGVRDAFRRLADHLQIEAQRVAVIMERAR